MTKANTITYKKKFYTTQVLTIVSSLEKKCMHYLLAKGPKGRKCSCSI